MLEKTPRLDKDIVTTLEVNTVTKNYNISLSTL